MKTYIKVKSIEGKEARRARETGRERVKENAQKSRRIKRKREEERDVREGELGERKRGH